MLNLDSINRRIQVILCVPGTLSIRLALMANFLRIFTILVLAELGYSKFAAGVYHDWAGLLFFFPIALSGLFLIDRLLNWKEQKKVVRKRVQ